MGPACYSRPPSLFNDELAAVDLALAIVFDGEDIDDNSTSEILLSSVETVVEVDEITTYLTS